jgi:hypothetical protein
MFGRSLKLEKCGHGMLGRSLQGDYGMSAFDPELTGIMRTALDDVMTKGSD